MTREEQIISEAEKYYSGDIKCYDAFLHGTDFADNNPNVSSLWHDVVELPQNTGHIMCINKHSLWYIEYVPFCLKAFKLTMESWKEFIEEEEIIKWCYLKDLIPQE